MNFTLSEIYTKLSSIFTLNRVIAVFFAGLLGLLLYFTRPFALHLQAIALLVMVIGLLALLLALGAKKQRKEFVGDLLRDVGIALVVAVVVTVIYEHSTRNLEERVTMLHTIDKTMAAVMPLSVWEEVKREVLLRHRIRRNVDIEFKILRNARLSNGKYITAPPGQVILWMKYGYDLYGMAEGGTYEPVQHELAYEMWNKELQIPRFESVSVIRDQGKQVKLLVGEELKRFCDGQTLRLGPDLVQLPAPQLNKPVRIVSERYELMGAPGSYNLVMPELTARVEGSNNPTIKVSVSEIPSDLEVKLTTYYAPHTFTPAADTDNVWVYNNIALPGQGFTLIVQPKIRPSMGAPV